MVMGQMNAEDLWRLKIEAKLMALQVMNTIFVAAIGDRSAIG